MQLVVEQLKKKYGTHMALNGLSLEVNSGEIVGLLGPNGAGKTTAFKVILGQTASDGGTVRYGQQLNGLPLHKRARLGIGYLPQTPSVFAQLSVKDNLVALLETRKMKDAHAVAEARLTQFQLDPMAHRKAATLSGGERRKLEIARALCLDPKMLLVDEPFAGVDPIAVEDLMKHLVALKHQGLGILLTDHSVYNALEVCDRIYLLVDGVVLESGTAGDIKQSTRAKELYLGENLFKQSDGRVD